MTLRLHLTAALEARLRDEATARGQDVEAYVLQTLQEKLSRKPENATGNNPPSPEEFTAALAELSFTGPALPADFSRADIYDDHR
jgi:hypothetical protein